MISSRFDPNYNPRITIDLDQEEKKLHKSIVEACCIHKLSYAKTNKVLRQVDEELRYDALNSKEVW